MTILLFRLLLSFCFDWENISNTRDCVSSAIQTPRISSKNIPLRVVFSTFFLVFGYPYETLSIVFDILTRTSIFKPFRSYFKIGDYKRKCKCYPFFPWNFKCVISPVFFFACKRCKLKVNFRVLYFNRCYLFRVTACQRLSCSYIFLMMM